ncbi:hypothetical protein D3C78_1851610 [compost metagenome]
MPSSARRTSLEKVYFTSPAWRASRSYSRPIWRKPIQLRMPRTKRLRSGKARSMSATRRSIKEKSPASKGMSTAVMAFMRR